MRFGQPVLIFLSKGYFFSGSPPFTLATLHSLALAPQFQLTLRPHSLSSGNCQKEVAATIANGNPIILLHEADKDRGGAPLQRLRDDCRSEWRDDVFGCGTAVRPAG